MSDHARRDVSSHSGPSVGRGAGLRRGLRVLSLAAAAFGLTAGLLGSTALPADAAGAGTATSKEFRKIKGGQSLAKVRKVVSGSGAHVTGITEARIQVWRSTGGKNAYVLFEDGRVADKVRLDDQTVSKAEYRKLKKGRSYRSTSKTIRESGSLLFDYREGGKHYRDYLWVDDTFTTYVWVEFVNGKLAWKAQIPVDDFGTDSRTSAEATVSTSVLAGPRSSVESLTR